MKRFRGSLGWMLGGMAVYLALVLGFAVARGASAMPAAPAAGPAAFGKPTTSSPIALSANNELLWVVNPDSDTVSVFRTSDNAKVISDIYPYSVTNTGLTGERAFSWLWRGLEKIGQNPSSKLGLMTMLINARNALQLFVSADRRYGPVYNLGVANEIYQGLLRNGRHPRSDKPIVLLGWSGHRPENITSPIACSGSATP